jgi:hypothetical protein
LEGRRRRIGRSISQRIPSSSLGDLGIWWRREGEGGGPQVAGRGSAVGRWGQPVRGGEGRGGGGMARWRFGRREERERQRGRKGINGGGGEGGRGRLRRNGDFLDLFFSVFCFVFM